jgi:hypothetical protein
LRTTIGLTPSRLLIIIRQGDHAKAIEWFNAYIPRCMALVLTRRRKTFLRGVYCYVIEEDTELSL